ncbi:glycosyltransferase [Flavisolibacter sp. BT320]|nr:glycosyltransferase [Flavisolibacter longurius]
MSPFSVSVIIPVYNAARYLTEAVASAVALPDVIEVLLVEDASSDDSLQVCFILAEKYRTVHVLQHADKKNHGVAASRNLGIRAAKADFIAFLDADDYYLPGRFEKEREIFASNADVDGVYGCNKAVFENEDVKKKFLQQYESEVTTVSQTLPPGELFKALLYGGYGRFHTSAITLRKSIFFSAGFFNTSLRMAEDSELWLKLSLKGKLVAGSIDLPVAIRRVHGSNSIHQTALAVEYRKRMYEALFPWALKQDVSFDVKNSFFITLHKHVIGEQHGVKTLLWQQVIRHPRLLFSSFFYKKIHQLYLL